MLHGLPPEGKQHSRRTATLDPIAGSPIINFAVAGVLDGTFGDNVTTLLTPALARLDPSFNPSSI